MKGECFGLLPLPVIRLHHSPIFCPLCQTNEKIFLDVFVCFLWSRPQVILLSHLSHLWSWPQAIVLSHLRSWPQAIVLSHLSYPIICYLDHKLLYSIWAIWDLDHKLLYYPIWAIWSWPQAIVLSHLSHLWSLHILSLILLLLSHVSVVLEMQKCEKAATELLSRFLWISLLKYRTDVITGDQN